MSRLTDHQAAELERRFDLGIQAWLRAESDGRHAAFQEMVDELEVFLDACWEANGGA